MTFRSCDCRRLDLPPDGSRWTALQDAGEGAFAFGRQIEGDETCRTIMINIPYTAWHAPIHVLRIVRTVVTIWYDDQGNHVEHRKPAPGEVVPSHSHAWEWDGNEDKPTLAPSIACGRPKGCDWHGYMTAGRLEACE